MTALLRPHDLSNAGSAREPGFRHLAIERAGPAVGAFVTGIDLSTPPTPAAVVEIELALARYGVIFFRDQTLSPPQYLDFARRLGEIDVNRFFRAVEGFPEIAEVRKEPHQRSNIGGNWHTDHSYDEIPARASLLYAIDLPRIGGDTIFASTVAAFNALSPAVQATLKPLTAVHSSRHVFSAAAKARAATDLDGRVGNEAAATQDAVHPVVVTHPLTGDRALYVNPGFTLRFDGWTEAESAGLLSTLYDHIKRPEFHTRFAWKPGSLAIWDNRTTWHLAVNDYAGERRLLHRITLQGHPLA